MNEALDSFVNITPHLISALTAFAALVACIFGLLNNRRFGPQDKALEKISDDVNGHNAAMVAATKVHTDELADLVKEKADETAETLQAKFDKLQGTVEELRVENARLNAIIEAKS